MLQVLHILTQTFTVDLAKQEIKPLSSPILTITSSSTATTAPPLQESSTSTGGGGQTIGALLNSGSPYASSAGFRLSFPTLVPAFTPASLPVPSPSPLPVPTELTQDSISTHPASVSLSTAPNVWLASERKRMSVNPSACNSLLQASPPKPQFAPKGGEFSPSQLPAASHTTVLPPPLATNNFVSTQKQGVPSSKPSVAFSQNSASKTTVSSYFHAWVP